jgi:hypothetical protein
MCARRWYCESSKHELASKADVLIDAECFQTLMCRSADKARRPKKPIAA